MSDTIFVQDKAIKVTDFEGAISQILNMIGYGKNKKGEFADNQNKYWHTLLWKTIELFLKNEYPNYDIEYQEDLERGGYYSIKTFLGVNCIVKTRFIPGQKEKMIFKPEVL